MDNQIKKEFGWMKLIPILVIFAIVIFALIIYENEKKEKAKMENDVQQILRRNEAIQRERENEVQRYANIALNPLKVKSINFVCSRLSVTELLKILINYETRNAFDSYERDSRNNSLRFDISHVLNWTFNVNFSDTIAGYIVGEDIYFQMPDETRNRNVTISSEEMIRWIVESIYNRKNDLERIPANERNRSYLLYEIYENGDIGYKIVKK
jgi:hypothetical protein